MGEGNYQSESETRSEVAYDDKENFAAKLRWLRWKIYSKLRNGKSALEDVRNYERLVRKFINKFQYTHLQGWEVNIWRMKVATTKLDVFKYDATENGTYYEASSVEVITSQAINPWGHDNYLDVEENDSEAATFETSDIVSGNRNSSEVLKPAVQDFLNWVKAEEEVVQNLPDVPKADEVAECQTVAAKVDDISDEELLLRLYKLKNDDVPKADPDEELLLRLDKR